VSNQLAIASVTATLHFRLSQLVAAELPSAQVTSVRPSAENLLPPTGINIFLYQVTPNSAQRNSALPTRNSEGRLVGRPSLPLDLHYVLSFYGNDATFEPQQLLGSVARSLHEKPVLDADTIAAMASDPLYDSVQQTDLMNALEPVRLTQAALTLEEMAKLWGIFYGVPYALSAVYVASAVNLDSESLPQAALPVRSFQVGALPREVPVLSGALSDHNGTAVLAPTDRLVLSGHKLLGGTSQSVLIDGADAAIVSGAGVLPLEVALLPGIGAGVHSVQLLQHVQVTPTFAAVVQSNVQTFAIAPQITGLSATLVPDADGTGVGVAVTANVVPEIGATQRLQLALTEIGAPPFHSHFLQAERTSSSQVTAFAKPTGSEQAIATGSYVVRVFVDGVPSPLGPATGPYSSPSVTVS